MEEKSLAVAFGESLKEETVSCISEFAEVGLDSILEDGILKEIPFVSTAMSLYRVGRNVAERHYIKKLAVFLCEINRNIADDYKRQEYIAKVKSDSKFRSQELEYLLVLIERYISLDKPQMLAKIYLAYLEDVIIWEELTMYAEVVDRLLILDYKMLISDVERTIIHRNIGGEAILRLVALGLMIEISDKAVFKDDGNGGFALTWDSLTRAQSSDRVYIKTEFGAKLADILR